MVDLYHDDPYSPRNWDVSDARFDVLLGESQEQTKSGGDFVVHRAYKSPYMKTWGHYYYHVPCWDEKERSVGKENCMTGVGIPSSSLSPEHMPIVYGFVHLVPLAIIASSTTCSHCFQPIHPME